MRTYDTVDGDPGAATPDARTTIQYLVDGSVGEVDDGAGVVAYGYDARGLNTTVIAPGGLTLIYTYDVLGRLSSRSAPNDTVVRWGYDLGGRLVSLDNRRLSDEAALADYSEISYDVSGQRTAMTGPAGPCVSG